MHGHIVYFIIGFVATLLALGSFIAFVGAKLSNTISQRIFGLIEKIIIGGILLGIIGMFQPWMLSGYRIGFPVLFFSTLAYIVWSHVTPKSG
jgi:hypothetical protein